LPQIIISGDGKNQAVMSDQASKLRSDFGYLARIAKVMDEIQLSVDNNEPSPELSKQLAKWEMTKVASTSQLINEISSMLWDLEAYFLYLTIDAIQNEELATRLIESYLKLEDTSKCHEKFFGYLRDLLACKYAAKAKKIYLSREHFEKQFKSAAKILGLE
jgi:hypothetical protein